MIDPHVLELCVRGGERGPRNVSGLGPTLGERERKCAGIKEEERRKMKWRNRCWSLPGRFGPTTAVKVKHKKERKEKKRYVREDDSC